MAPRLNEMLIKSLHPYMFVLKEGRGIKEDYLDYSLLMLQISSPEVLPSPEKYEPSALPPLRHGFYESISDAGSFPPFSIP